MATFTLYQKVSGGVELVEASQAFNGTLPIQLDAEDIPADSTDLEIIIGIDVSAIQLIIILASHDLKLETNSGAAPDDTLNLLAGQPYIWYVASYYTNLLTVDITSIFVTEENSDDATLDILALVDATP